MNYFEGEVWVGARQLSDTFSILLISEGSQLRTAAGRAEVLLTEGMFLRVAEDSAVAMRKNAAETVIDVLRGSVIAEGEALTERSVVLRVGDAAVSLGKRGLYRIEAAPPLLRVYDGAASVTARNAQITVKAGRSLALAEKEFALARFDSKAGDAFSRWSRRRGEALSFASYPAARRLYELGRFGGGWYFSDYLGCYTYLPWHRHYYQHVYYSPEAMVERRPMYSSDLGYNTAPRSSGVYDSGGSPQYSSSPATSSAGSPPAAVNPRTSDSASGIDTGGRGR